MTNEERMTVHEQNIEEAIEFFRQTMPKDDVDDCQYLGVVSRVKDHQALMNMEMLEVSNNMAIMKDFNSWFNSYSFAYVPEFCKPLIKKWLFAAYKSGVKSNDK